MAIGIHFDEDSVEYDKPILGLSSEEDNNDYDHSIMFHRDDYERNDYYDRPIIGLHDLD